MKKFLYASLIGLASVGLVACSSDSDDEPANTTAGDTTAGDTTAGDTTAGDTTAGDTTAGDTTAGDTTAGDTTAGDTTAGDTTGGDTTAGDTTGGDTTGGDISGNVLNWGIVEIDEDEDEISASAFFGAFATALTASQFNDELIPTLDTCEVSTSTIGEIDIDDLEDELIFETEFTSLSAGDNITISSPTGTYVTLDKFSFAGLIGYESDVSLNAPAPNGLVVDIPGDDTRAYSNVAIPDVLPLVVSSPAAGVPITPASTFTWSPGSGANSIIDFSVSAIDGTTGFINVDCELVDDGSFSFPTNIQNQMGAGFSSTFLDFYRTRFTIFQNGNEVLVTSNTVSGGL